jgi:hypothetical protein
MILTYILYPKPSIWTFKIKPIKQYVDKHIREAKNILIPFAGQIRFPYPNVTYIDIMDNMPVPYIKGDSFEILPQLVKEGNKYDLIISDPPYTAHQSVVSYGNSKFQQISILKHFYNQLLEENGVVIHFGFNSSVFGAKYSYVKEELLIINLGMSHNDILVLKERKVKNADYNYVSVKGIDIKDSIKGLKSKKLTELLK